MAWSGPAPWPGHTFKTYMNSAVDIIQALGFPIFVCLWLMYRVEKRLDKIHKEQHRSNILQAVIVKVLDEGTAVPDNVVDEITGKVPVLPVEEEES